MADLVSLLVVVMTQFLALTALGAGPGLAAWRWARLPAAFLPVCVLAAAFLIAYGVLGLWLIDHTLATGAVRSACGVSLLLAIREIRHTGNRDALTNGAVVLALSALVAFAWLLVLAAVPVDASARFGVGLPNDNVLPRYLADRFYDPKVSLTSVAGTLDGIYLTSDRPPLQSAGLLALWALVPYYRLTTYQVFGTLCQIGWIPALFALTAALRWTRRERVFVLAGVACSGFALLNTVYTWPKLLAAWLFLAGLAVWLTRDAAAIDARRARTIVGSVLVALAALAHGGVGFSLLTLPILALLIGPAWRPTWPAVAMGAVVWLVVMAPWLAYQTFVDPPGNRLLKWHLAGVDAVDARGLGRTLVDQYAETPLPELLRARTANVREQWFTTDGAPSADWRAWLQWQQFFHHVPALDTLVAGLVAVFWLAPRRAAGGEEHVAATRALAWAAVATWVLWLALMFIPGSALVHQGSYANTLLLFALGALGLAWLPPRVGLTLLVAHVVVFAWGWLGISAPPVTPRLSWLTAGSGLFAVALTGLAWTASRLDEPAH